jgi:hypothetical protein
MPPMLHVPYSLHVPLRALALDVENSHHSGLLKLGSRAYVAQTANKSQQFLFVWYILNLGAL